MDLNELKPIPGSRKPRKRVGRGTSSGHGKTSTRGQKGQRARAGRSVGRGFEGGQMPLQRRLPKRGFNNTAFSKEYALVNVGDLAAFPEGTTVDVDLLKASGMVRRTRDGVKVLGEGELTHAISVRANRFSAGARQKIEAAGGSAVCVDLAGTEIPWPDATASAE
ncbi:50S ribosomal protein L15 [Myxococcota bacterium]|nr:50S ribosomal protein L15 [Myxococcota bacterium]